MQQPLDVYLAGPMTGLPGFNFGEFLRIERKILQEYEWRVFSPARHEINSGIVDYPAILDMDGSPEELATMSFNKNAALMRDMGAIAEARIGTVLMDGWTQSSGARLEAMATLWVGKILFEVSEGTYKGDYFFKLESLDPNDALSKIHGWHNEQS